MRTLFRTLAATAVLTALVLGTAVSAVLAASPSGNSATVERYDYDEAWCFDYGTSYDCSVVDATLSVTTTPDGRDIARIHFRMNVKSFDPSGVQIGTSQTVALDRSVYADGGQDQTFSVTHTRAVGDFGTCVSTYLFKIVDFELQFEKYTGPGCH
jgi:hypothetical protein